MRALRLALVALLLSFEAFTSAYAGGHFNVIKHHLAPVVQPTGLVYDNRFGTDTAGAALTGDFTFALHSGNRRIYVDDQRPDDSGNGLTPATAEKTFAAGYTDFVTGYTPGDHLMFAGGTLKGVYTDPGSTSGLGNFTGYAGISNAYPTVIESYDRADPTNAAKFGKLIGDQRPIINIASVSGTTVFRKSSSDGTDNYVAFDGLIFDGGNTAGPALEFTDRHDGMVFQNDTFRYVELLFNNASSIYGFSQNISVTKSSFFGAWFTDGNSACMFDHGTNAMWVTDSVMLHCAWKIGASRDDATTAGGTHSGGQGHAHYHHATSTNARFMRNVYGDDSADGYNGRGDVIGSDIVAIDEPIAITIGGFSSLLSERPNGIVGTLDNVLVLGGNSINTSQPRGYGFNIQNTLAGSYARNGVLIENPFYGLSNNKYATYTATGGGLPSYYFLYDNIRGYNYSNLLQAGDGYSGGTAVVSWTNSILDVAAAGTNGGTATGNSIWNGTTFPLKKTPAQIYTAMGFASRNAMFDAMAAYPQLPWAQALISIGLPAYGLTSTTAPIISPPDISGLPAPTSISWGS